MINILGLSTGMASAMLIFLWINDEMSFDRFHAKENRLFQIYREEISNGPFRRDGKFAKDSGPIP
ncbi:MAG: ABC transporter permease [Puia sp.]